MAERIAEMAICLWHGDLETVAAWLQSIGKEATIRGNQLNIKGAVNTGTTPGGDPWTQAVTLMFALFGAWWPFMSVSKGIKKLVDEAWKADLREAKAKTLKKKKVARQLELL